MCARPAAAKPRKSPARGRAQGALVTASAQGETVDDGGYTPAIGLFCLDTHSAADMAPSRKALACATRW